MSEIDTLWTCTIQPHHDQLLNTQQCLHISFLHALLYILIMVTRTFADLYIYGIISSMCKQLRAWQFTLKILKETKNLVMGLWNI